MPVFDVGLRTPAGRAKFSVTANTSTEAVIAAATQADVQFGKDRWTIVYVGPSGTAPATDIPTQLSDDQRAALQRLRVTSAVARWNNPKNRAVMSSPPTIADATSADGTLTVVPEIFGARGGVYTYGGGYAVSLFTNFLQLRSHTVNGLPASGVSYISMVTDAPVIQFRTYPSGTEQGLRFIIDGQYASLTPTTPAATNASNYTKLTFSGAARRHIVVEMRAQCAFRSAAVGPIYDIYKSPIQSPRMFFQGDSFVASGTNSAFHDGIGATCAQYLGVQDYWVGGVGGTGWTATGSGQTTFRQRNADVITSAADFVVACGGHNDGSGASGVQAEVSAWIRETREALPNAVFFVLGAWPGDRGPDADQLAAEAAISAGVAAVNDPGTVFIPVCTDPNGSWVTGTGRTGFTTGVGNSDRYQGGDATHPSPEGYLFYGERTADAIMRAVETLLAT